MKLFSATILPLFSLYLLIYFKPSSVRIDQNQIIDSSEITTDSTKFFIGKKLPPFKVISLKGDTINSNSFLGKKLVLNFWFTKCSPCVAEIPHLNQINEDYEGKDVCFISMTPDPSSTVLEFLREKKINYPIITDQKAYIEQFNNVYPKSIFVNTKGIIMDIQGSLPLDVERGIEDMLDPNLEIPKKGTNYLSYYMNPQLFYTIIDSLD